MSAMINGVLDCLYDGQLEIYLAENSMQENEKEHFRAGSCGQYQKSLDFYKFCGMMYLSDVAIWCFLECNRTPFI